MEIPLGLKQAIETGNCVLFLGAGMGSHLKQSSGVPAPTARDLAIELADEFDIESNDPSDLAQIAGIVELRKGRIELETFVRQRLENLIPDEAFKWLFTLRWRAIYTTNYDNSILRAYELISNISQQPKIISSTSDLSEYDPRFDIPIYYLHGTLFGPNKPKIIITEDDYLHFRERRNMLFQALKLDFATSTILYVGYSNIDGTWKTIFSEISTEFYPSQLPMSYRVAPTTDKLDIELLQSKNVNTLEGSFQEFYTAALTSIQPISLDIQGIARVREQLPPEFLKVYDQNPAPVVRLLSNWHFVNRAPFDGHPNTTDFLKGDMPNWALIGANQVFERDIEEDIYESMIDYATSNRKSPVVNLLLAPAGYGTTTILMKLATKLIREGAGNVFMLRHGFQFNEGDMEFALDALEGPTFFIIDDAADYAETLGVLVTQFAERGKSAFFMLGSRMNEWRQTRRKPVPKKEFSLEPLSDPEIRGLLDYLASRSALNVLENLTPELQFAAIKERHKKELLVAMREATEGKSFDAILESEFHRIGDSKSKEIYLIVCCFYQYGTHVRDKLLADLVDLSVTTLYDDTKDPTEGVVIYDCSNEGRQIYGARTRHRVIASVVWERCGEKLQREHIIQKALKALNLNYKADKDAFESFVRSDRMVDTISTIEGRVQFFDEACRKDPDSPYVLQHYARMLLRAQMPILALDQINKGIEINPRARVLYHTKGMIEADLAKSLDSLELGRKRMAQSEASFRHGLRLYENDDFCFSGLAQLYFDWAKRPDAVSESLEYLSKAESVINEGLRKVRDKESLWIVSAQIQEWIGNEPGRFEALAKAVASTAGSSIARYLLGKAYRKRGDYLEACKVLQPLITSNFDEHRPFIEYALALHGIDGSYKDAIAILQQSTLYGLSDARFIATLGGMLFMNKQFSDGKKIFDGAAKRDLKSIELKTIHFKPLDPQNLNEELSLKGNVVDVKQQYSFIEASGYQRFLCPGSKYNGIVMTRGLDVVFKPGFCANGAIAVDIKLP